MISSEQEQQITAYLNSKKMYSQLLFEVKDHFISQILNVMETKGLSFQEAFLETKIGWKKELEMVKADFFSFKKIARVEKEILQQRFNNMMVYSLLLSVFALLLLLINPELFTILQVSLLGSWVLFLGYSFISKKMKFSEYMTLSFHPLLVRYIFLIMVIFSLNYFFKIDFLTGLLGQEITKIFLVYAMGIQLQLLYFKTKRVNVLI